MFHSQSTPLESSSREATPTIQDSQQQSTKRPKTTRRTKRIQKEITRSALPPEKPQPDINNYNISDWEPRTDAECRTQSQEYLAAPTLSKAEFCFHSSGKRWSELEQLPYFNITCFVVVDPMHNLFLGVLKEHFRDILGFRPTRRFQKQRSEKFTAAPVVVISIEATEDNPLPGDQATRNHVYDLIKWLGEPMSDMLEDDATADMWERRFRRCNLSSLRYVSVGLHLIPSEVAKKILRKTEFIEALKTWVRVRVPVKPTDYN